MEKKTTSKEKIMNKFANSVILYCDEQISTILLGRLEEILTSQLSDREEPD